MATSSEQLVRVQVQVSTPSVPSPCTQSLAWHTQSDPGKAHPGQEKGIRGCRKLDDRGPQSSLSTQVWHGNPQAWTAQAILSSPAQTRAPGTDGPDHYGATRPKREPQARTVPTTREPPSQTEFHRHRRSPSIWRDQSRWVNLVRRSTCVTSSDPTLVSLGREGGQATSNKHQSKQVERFPVSGPVSGFNSWRPVFLHSG